MTQTVFKPTVVIEELGELGTLPNGGIINAGGVEGPVFTVGGRQVVLDVGGSGGTLPINTGFGYEHVQAMESTVWIIQHNKETERLTVMIWDEVNDAVFPDVVRVVNNNTVHIVFNTPISGRAILFYF